VSIDVDDELWAAIGEPTRRRVLDLLLAGGGGTASGLSRELPVSRQAVAKHLGILQHAGLVAPRHVGREVRYAVDAEQFARAVAQLAAVGQAWDLRSRRIRSLAEEIEQKAQNLPDPRPAHPRTRS
jgi:DNA-binding transcriptional ArsR family regulator